MAAPSPRPLPRLPCQRETLTPVGVYSVWALVTLAALATVWHFGLNAPVWDEWTLIPVGTGNRAITWSWLWAQHNGHRIPLPKLYLALIYRLTNCNFTAPMYGNVAILAGSALALMLTARNLRGRVSLTDVFFPFVLLQWGPMESWLSGFGVQMILCTAFTCLALIGILKDWLLLVGSCLVFLSLCGATGSLMALPLAIWLLVQAFRRRSLASFALLLISGLSHAPYASLTRNRALYLPAPLDFCCRLTELLGDNVMLRKHMQNELLVAALIAMLLLTAAVIACHALERTGSRTHTAFFCSSVALVALLFVLPLPVTLRWELDAVWVYRRHLLIERASPIGMIVLLLAVLSVRRPVIPVVIGEFLVLAGIIAGRHSVDAGRYITATLPLWPAIYFVAGRTNAAKAVLTLAAMLLFVSSIPYGIDWCQQRDKLLREFATAVNSEPWEKVAKENKKAYELDWANHELARQNTDVHGCIEMLRQIGHPAFPR